MNTHYVVGLAFDKNTRDRVILIEKKHGPDYLIGKLAPPGGHIEEGETHYEAMTREFHEETGLNVHLVEWTYLALKKAKNGLDLHYFVAFLDEERMHAARSTTEEKVSQYFWNNLPGEILAPGLPEMLPKAAKAAYWR